MSKKYLLYYQASIPFVMELLVISILLHMCTLNKAFETETMTKWMTYMTPGYHCTMRMHSSMAFGSRQR